nr:uncharacterized protein LOC108058085 [Drosophila takahashii]
MIMTLLNVAGGAQHGARQPVCGAVPSSLNVCLQQVTRFCICICGGICICDSVCRPKELVTWAFYLRTGRRMHVPEHVCLCPYPSSLAVDAAASGQQRQHSIGSRPSLCPARDKSSAYNQKK